ncbi:MAG: hypothetical protein ABW133_05580, partial [Polyangiaceae bacterium]
GVTESVGRGLGTMVGMRLGWRPQDPSGFTVSLDGAWGQGAFSEWRVLASGGYRLGFRRNRFTAFGGVEIGAGVAGQKTTPSAAQTDTSAWSGALLAAPGLGATYQFGDRIALGLEGTLNVLAYRRADEGTLTASVLPAVYLGVAMDF